MSCDILFKKVVFAAFALSARISATSSSLWFSFSFLFNSIDSLAACFAFASAALAFLKMLRIIDKITRNKTRELPIIAKTFSSIKSTSVTFFSVFSYMDSAPVNIEDGIVFNVFAKIPINTVFSLRVANAALSGCVKYTQCALLFSIYFVN